MKDGLEHSNITWMSFELHQMSENCPFSSIMMVGIGHITFSCSPIGSFMLSQNTANPFQIAKISSEGHPHCSQWCSGGIHLESAAIMMVMSALRAEHCVLQALSSHNQTSKNWQEKRMWWSPCLSTSARQEWFDISLWTVNKIKLNHHWGFAQVLLGT